MLNFTAFNTEPFYDVVTVINCYLVKIIVFFNYEPVTDLIMDTSFQVFESLDQTIDTLIFRASGVDFPSPMTTVSNVALVTLITTNNANTYPGCSLDYEAIVP